MIDPIAREAAWNRGSEVGGWAERALALMGDDPTPWQWVRLATGLKASFADADMVEALRIADSILDDPDLPAMLRVDALIQRAINLSALGDLDGCVRVLDDAWNQVSTDPAIDPYDPTAIGAGSNLAIFLALVGETSRAATVAQESLQRAQALGGPSTLSLAHFAVGFAYLDPDPTRAVVSFEEALRYSDLGASNIVRDRSMHMLALVAWRAGDSISAARHLARALSESFAMGDYSSRRIHARARRPDPRRP